MLSEKMVAALNKQINAEFYSSYLYMSMGAHFEHTNMPGFAKWMHMQAQEEWMHGMKIFKYVNERMGKVKLAAIDEPSDQWDNPTAAFQQVCQHEQKVTQLINDLVAQAIAEKDYATQSFLQWFVNEQVEEEASATAIFEKLQLIGGNTMGLFMMDAELGRRGG